MAEWTEAMANLNKRRAANDIKSQPIIDDYKAHMAKALNCGWIKPGDCVLDVGCGDMKIFHILKDFGWVGDYTGLDPFPMNPMVREGVIEDWTSHERIDAAVCFAVLDGTKDIKKALEVLNRIVKRSIIILTGIGIEPDYCHTFRIDLDLLKHGINNFRQDSLNYLHPKVILTHFERSVES